MHSSDNQRNGIPIARMQLCITEWRVKNKNRVAPLEQSERLKRHQVVNWVLGGRLFPTVNALPNVQWRLIVTECRMSTPEVPVNNKPADRRWQMVPNSVKTALTSSSAIDRDSSWSSTIYRCWVYGGWPRAPASRCHLMSSNDFGHVSDLNEP